MAKDHFVSQFYLHGFTGSSGPNSNDPGVWAVDRRHPGKPKRRSPGAIAFEHGYNDWIDPTPTRANVSLEKEYGELESWAAPIIRKLDRRDTRLDAEERDKLAMFMAVHMSRPPGVRATMTSIMNREERQRFETRLADDGFVKDLIEYMEGDVPTDQRTTVDEVRSMLLDPDVEVSVHPNNVKARAYGLPLLQLTPLLLRCGWGLCVAAKGRSFLTCDRPLALLSRDPARPNPDFTCYDNSHITAFFPLTQNVALEMRGQQLRSVTLRPIPPGARIAMYRLSPTQTTIRNQSVIQMSDRYIFCSDEAQARWALTELQARVNVEPISPSAASPPRG